MRPHHLALILSFAIATVARAQVASIEEITDLVNNRQYAPALRHIAAGLALKGQAAQLADRHQLFMLKAECHLQTRALPQAVEAYANAAKEEQATRDQRAVAAAHVALLKATKAFAYTPKAPPTPDKGRPSPIDVLDKSNRKLALIAMLADEHAAAAAKFKAAKAATTLKPIADCAAPLASIEGFELAAKGEAPQATALRTELVTRSKKVVADALRDYGKRVSAVDKEANTFVETWQEAYELTALGNPRPRKERVFKKKGLTDAQTATLQETSATCAALDENLPQLAAALNADPATFDPFAEDASRLRKDVARILDIDYQKAYREIPK